MAGVRLETDRLRLRSWRDSDLDAWVDMSADPRVMEFFPRVRERSEAEAEAALLRSRLERDGYGWWALEVKGGPAFAGCIALQAVPFEAPFTPAFEVGWRLAYAAWGHGYATEGARAALRFAFDSLGWSEVVAITASLNLRSQRVMERLGMTRDPRDDFMYPRLEAGHRLRPHVLYRATKMKADNGAGCPDG